MAESYWDTDYWHAMDRFKGKDVININPQKIGISHGIGDPLQGLKSNIFVGASQVELGFMGQGKGFRGQPTGWTPESVSAPEREAIKQLAQINEIELSTHATPNVAISGIGEQGFNPQQQRAAVDEVKKAIDFAADTAEGGKVVFHAQEFPRPIFEKFQEEKFLHYKEEPERAPLYVVDKRTGQLKPLPRNQEVAVPKGTIEEPERDESGFIIWENKTVAQLEKEAKEKNQDPIKYIYETIVAKETEYEEGSERNIASRIRNAEEQHNFIKEKIASIEKQKKENLEHAKHSAIVAIEESRFDPPKGTKAYKEFLEDPFQRLKELETTTKSHLDGEKEVERAFGRRAFERNQEVKNSVSIEEYGVEQSAKAIADAAMYGYEVEKKRGLQKPITLVPENWTPEQYGSHPQELKKLVQESRKVMADQLVKQKGLERDQAQNMAKERVKATFDIGHLNMWRKYFEGSDEEFKGWVDKQVKDLTQSGIIGHVHLTDNFGYHDEHLTPGEGTAPVKEFLQRLETEGYEGAVIGEPGGQPEGKIFQAMTGSWGLSDYSMYKIDGSQRSWSEIEGSYFGRTEGPRFIVGDAAPSKEWTLWSEVPLE